MFASLKQPEQPKQPKGLFTVIRDTFGDDTSPHNCYGMGNKQCVRDGYRTEGIEEKSPVNRDRAFDNINVMYPIYTIHQLNKEIQDSKGKQK